MDQLEAFIEKALTELVQINEQISEWNDSQCAKWESGTVVGVLITGRMSLLKALPEIVAENGSEVEWPTVSPVGGLMTAREGREFAVDVRDASIQVAQFCSRIEGLRAEYLADFNGQVIGETGS